MKVLHISCNMGTRDLHDMYALSPRACGPQALGMHIRQITCVHVTTITCTLSALAFYCLDLMLYTVYR